jgi:hypothetical protein
MASILTLDAIGPHAEKLAMEAGKATDIPVGYDAEFHCATFDSDSLEDDQLQATVIEALAGIDPDWQIHLALAE